MPTSVAMEEPSPLSTLAKSIDPSKFGSKLAHADKRTRDKAVKSLSKWLQSNTPSQIDMLKLWKGLFYCFWMSDKSHVQVHLAENLASLVRSLDDNLAQLYLDSFWKTIAKEWPGIDRIRLDKFYMLMRKFHAASANRMISKNWSQSCISALLYALPLTERAEGVAESIRYHIIQVFFEEMSTVLDTLSISSRPSHSSLNVLLAPFIKLLATASDKPLSSMVQQEIFMQMINQDAIPSCFANLDLGDMAKTIFQTGSEEGVSHYNRKVLYEVSGALADASGTEVSVDKQVYQEESMDGDLIIVENDSKVSDEDSNELKRKAMGDDDVSVGEANIESSPAVQPAANKKAKKTKRDKSVPFKVGSEESFTMVEEKGTSEIPVILEEPPKAEVTLSKKSKKAKKRAAAKEALAAKEASASLAADSKSLITSETIKESVGPTSLTKESFIASPKSEKEVSLKSLKSKKKAKKASSTSGVIEKLAAIIDSPASSLTVEIHQVILETSTQEIAASASETSPTDVKKSVSWGKNATKTFMKRNSITTVDAVLKQAACEKVEKALTSVLKKTAPVIFDASVGSAAGPIRTAKKGGKSKKVGKKSRK